MADKGMEVFLAKNAYEGYCRETGGVSPVTGDTLPTWDDLPAAVRSAWWRAAEEVVDIMLDGIAAMIAEMDLETFVDQYYSEKKDA